MDKNKLISVDEFQALFNKKLFDGSRMKLLNNIAAFPDRFLGLFRPTKPTTKLIQNITQSHEIRFGDALEEAFAKYFVIYGCKLLPRRIVRAESGEVLTLDQLFEFNDRIYFIEQKVRDDHDSTKKRGQFTNFENKYFELTQIYKDKQIDPIMWFIDDSLKKNKNYYLSEIQKMNNSYSCKAKLCYGKELFNGEVISGCDVVIWNEVIFHLKFWKETLPDIPEINFDSEPKEVLKELVHLKPSVIRILFENKEIASEILPVLFPSGETLNKLLEIYCKKTEHIYKHLQDLIKSFLLKP